MRRLRLLLVLLAVSAFLFLMPARFTAPARVAFDEAAGPVQSAAYHAAGDALAASGTLSDRLLGGDRRRALRRELTRLRNRNAALQDAVKRERMRLESAEKLRVKRFRFRALRAPVSSYDASGVRRGIGVRAGSSDGVRAGLPVASRGALVGIVMRAGPRQSRVRLITDPRSAVPCRLGPDRSVCILQGTGGPVCRVVWVDREAFVEPGDTAVTASLDVEPRGDLRLPDGLPAARVLSAERSEMRPLFYDVRAEPLVDLRRLEEVEVLIPTDDGTAEIDTD